MTTTTLVFFRLPSTSLPGNAATGAVTAANGVTTNTNGIVVADTTLGVLQTGQTIAAVVNTTSRYIPIAGIGLGATRA